MQKFTNFLHTFSSPFQDAAAYCKAETRSNSFGYSRRKRADGYCPPEQCAERGRRTTITAWRCSYKKAEQRTAVRPFLCYRLERFKYISGCPCKMASIRYNKTERSMTMELTGSYRHELKYQISPADHHALRQRLRTVMKCDLHTGADGLYTIRSVYFDNYGDKALREKVNGVQKREKFRIRYHSQKKGRRTT